MGTRLDRRVVGRRVLGRSQHGGGFVALRRGTRLFVTLDKERRVGRAREARRQATHPRRRRPRPASALPARPAGATGALGAQGFPSRPPIATRRSAANSGRMCFTNRPTASITSPNLVGRSPLR